MSRIARSAKNAFRNATRGTLVGIILLFLALAALCLLAWHYPALRPINRAPNTGTRIASPPAASPHSIFGFVEALAGDNLTISSERGSLTMNIHISDTTVITDYGVDLSISNITIGSPVMVVGSLQHRVFEATSITLNPASGHRGKSSGLPTLRGTPPSQY